MIKLWDKYDMWYFRKHRKHSPLTEFQFKIQSKREKYQKKLSKRQRKAITITAIILIIALQFLVRLPSFIDDFEPDEVKDLENSMDKRDTYGKIYT